MKKYIQSPHDKIFRQLFSDKAKVEDFLRGTMPTEILKYLRFETLTQEPDSFVDEELREHLADIVYLCQFGEDTRIELAFLFEHKTRQPENPYWQLFRYIFRLWEMREKAGKPILPILPIIVYHGKKAWEQQRFEELFQGKRIPVVLKPFVPDFQYLLVDLHSSSDEKIRRSFHIPTLRVTLLLMKYIYDPNLARKLPLLLKEMYQILIEEGESGDINAFFVYLRSTVKEQIREQAMEKVQEEIEEYDRWGAVVGSSAYYLRKSGYEEGMEKGIEKGMEDGLENAARQLLVKGISVEETARLLNLDLERVKKLKEDS